ncbi:MAG: alpha/beta hydrolase [Chloroflexi bacterium]|nr:alpha/beta hydrolase [Chloroflexota bacterium]
MRTVLFIVVFLLAVVLVGPFFIPVPPLEGTQAPEQLADPDSQFIEVNGLRVHVKIAGSGEPVLVLLHGFGASIFSWREVMTPLGQWGTVIAFDRPGFGLTARPMPGEWAGENPYSPEYQADLTVALLDALGVERAVLVGHSAGGSVATLTALRHPERVQALILVDAAIYVGDGIPAWLRPLLHTPQARHLGPLLVRSIATGGETTIRLAWHDQTKVSPDILAGYKKPLQAEDWDRALWEFTLASHPLNLSAQLEEITIPVLVITGDQDRIVPTEHSIRLARELPDARLVVIPECGHLPQEERPEALLQAISDFLALGGLLQ